MRDRGIILLDERGSRPVKFKGGITVEDSGKTSADPDFIMVDRRPKPDDGTYTRPQEGSPRVQAPEPRIRRIVNIFKPGRDRHLNPPADSSFIPLISGKLDGAKFQLVNAPETEDPWKLFKD